MSIDLTDQQDQRMVQELVTLVNEKLVPSDEEKLSSSSNLLMIDLFDSLTMVSLLSFI